MSRPQMTLHADYRGPNGVMMPTTLTIRPEWADAGDMELVFNDQCIRVNAVQLWAFARACMDIQRDERT